VAVIGCGRMGKLHARTYAQSPMAKLVGVYDPVPASAAAAAAEYECEPFTDLDALLSQVAAVTIATPTQFHAAVAEICLKRGVACLIEKPLARNAAECLQIVQWAKQYGVTVQVGHIERFNPAMRAVQKLNLRPRFIEAIRISPLTFRSLDVGVVLDMMIHDIDLVLNLAGSPVARIDASGVGLNGDTEDICNARLTFQNGCVANITASRLALKTERKLRIFCADTFASIDFGKRTATVVRAGDNLPALRETAARVRAGEITDLSQLKYTDMVQLEPLAIEEIDPLRAQAESFISAVRDKRPAAVTAEDGWAAVSVAEQIVAAMRPEFLQG
jgi:predicted dehydrogenase